MLDFFRRYQRYFFLVITVVIIISFSFFGTYSTLGSNTWREQIAFKAVNGSEIPRLDVDQMSLFLSTDSLDKRLYGGVWGPNFLNDGVIRKNFLETGMAQQLALAYAADLQEDFEKRLGKEKKYVRYVHPQASFLSVEGIWDYFSPNMNGYFAAIQAAQSGLDPVAFNSRVQLYLAEKQLPGSTLRYILRHQEKQYPWLRPDERLGQVDLSLFGYHTVEDWFGPSLINLISEFIINTAILAESQGYAVSKAEAIADIVHNTQVSYQENLNNPNLGVTSPEEYLSEQLRRLNLDQAGAVKIWQQVLLFRRYFQDAAANVLVDDTAVRQLHQFAHRNVTVDLYQLPPPLQLSTFDDLQKFQAYLQAVSLPNASDPLSLPEQFRPTAEVAKTYPELVQKRYELEIAEVTQKALQARIGLRELWNWEMDDPNWKRLAQQFPILGKASATTREERFKTLDDLDATTQSIVDAFALQAIIQSHPEWVDQALTAATPEKKVVRLREQGGTTPFSGLDKPEQRQAFIRLLDEAAIGAAPPAESALNHFTADEKAYYRITVLERPATQEILTFGEAQTDETAGKVRDRLLEKYYVEIRKSNPASYQNDKGEWKPLKTIRDEVATKSFESVLTALRSLRRTLPDTQDNEKAASPDQLAALRFYPHFSKIEKEIEANPTQANRWIQVEIASDQTANELPKASPTLADQWKVNKSTVTYSRQKPEGLLDLAKAFALSPGAWSSIILAGNGHMVFYQVKDQGMAEINRAEVVQQIRQMQSVLGAEAQRQLMKHVLEKLEEKHALSLSYLRTPSED